MICDRVAILVAGKVATQGRMEDLNAAKRRYEIEVMPSENGTHAIHGCLAGLFTSSTNGNPGSITHGRLPNGTSIEIEESTVRIGSIDPLEIQSVLDRLRAANLLIRRVQPVKQSLEDLYMEAVVDPTTGRVAGAGAALNLPIRAFPIQPKSR